MRGSPSRLVGGDDARGGAGGSSLLDEGLVCTPSQAGQHMTETSEDRISWS